LYGEECGVVSNIPKRKIKLYITDDHVSVREGLKTILESKNFLVVGAFGTIEETLKHIFQKRNKPDVLILDLNIGTARGTETIDAVLATYPDAKIVIYSMREAMGTITASFEAGAKAFVTKSSDPKILREAIKVVANGEVYFMPGYAEQIALYHTSGEKLANPRKVLSDRELSIFIKVAKGKSAKIIAGELGIAAKSVSNRRITIRHKLGISNSDFHKLAVQYNLI